MPKREMSRSEVMKRYPCITAHVIAESLGYASPSCAAQILKDAREGKPNACEWIWSCYGCNPLPAVQGAVKTRHYHKGFMAEYKTALDLVRRANATGEEPMFGSWI